MCHKETRCSRKKAWKVKVSICICDVGHGKPATALCTVIHTDAKIGKGRIILASLQLNVSTWSGSLVIQARMSPNLILTPASSLDDTSKIIFTTCLVTCACVNLEVFMCGRSFLFFHYIKLIEFWNGLDWILCEAN